MGVSSKVMLENSISAEDIFAFIRDNLADNQYAYLRVSSWDLDKPEKERFTQIIFKYQGENRIFSTGDFPHDAKNCYGLSERFSRIGDLSMCGHSVEIMEKISSHFGGFYLASDCSGDDPVPNFEGLKGEISEESKLIAKLQFNFGDDAMIIYKHFNQIKEIFFKNLPDDSI